MGSITQENAKPDASPITTYVSHFPRVMLLIKLSQSRPRILGKSHLHPPFARGDEVENEHESRQKHGPEHHEHEEDWCELPRAGRKRGKEIINDEG